MFDSPEIPQKYRRAFDLGRLARLNDEPEDAYREHYTADDYLAAWRRGWQATDRRLSARVEDTVEAIDAVEPDPAVIDEDRRDPRDRRDALRLRAELLIAVGAALSVLLAALSAYFLYQEIGQQRTIIQQQAKQLDQQRIQIERQQADTLIVRRAQLLDTVYGETCSEPGAGGGSRATQTENDLSCRPRAHLRARQEAVLVFLEIERGRGQQQPNLRGVKLRRADLFEADLHGARLRGADLQQAFLYKANLRGAGLREADLRQVGLHRADLRGADLFQADLRDADLHRADLSEAENLTQEQIDVAKGDENTLLPEGLTRPSHWTAGPQS